MTGERKFFQVDEIPDMQQALNDGWKFDPWLNPSGRPHHMQTPGGGMWGLYWVLVKGTDEEIMALNPIYGLPEGELKAPDPGPDYVGLHTVRIPYEKGTGEPIREPPEGYVILHKDHIAATGTVYTKPPRPGAEHVLQRAKNRIEQRIKELLAGTEDVGICNTIIDELNHTLEILDPSHSGGPWCVDCIGVPLKPIYDSAHEVQSYECQECGRSYPVGGGS